MRFVVIQPAESTANGEPPVLPAVGVVRYYDPAPTLGFAVKATFSFAPKEGQTAPPEVAELSPSQLPLCLGVAAEGTDEELYYPCDFVPRKAAADVLLAGRAYSSQASLEVGSFRRRFVVASPGRVPPLPLLAEHIHGPGGEATQGVMARKIDLRPKIEGDQSPKKGPRFHNESFDYLAYCSAPKEQQTEWIDPSAPVTLEGLSPHGLCQFALPGLAPQVVVDGTDDRLGVLKLVCDTLWLDPEKSLGVLVWRGGLKLSSLRALEVERVVVALKPASAKLDEPALRQEMMRSRICFAVEEHNLSPEPADDDEPDRLTVARYELWTADEAPEPLISLARYAEISAEIAEKRESKEDILKRHNTDEDRWLTEERAWLEKIAASAGRGDATLADEYGALYVAAQDRLAAPEEAHMTLADYAAISVAVDGAHDIEAVFAEHKLTLPAWLRIDRRFKEEMAANPQLCADFEREVAALSDTGPAGDSVGSQPPAEDDL